MTKKLSKKPDDQRKPILDKYPDKKAKIVEIIEAGNFVQTAYEAVGISRTAFYDYCKKNPDYADDIKKAERKSERGAVTKLQAKIEEGNMTAIIFYLKTRFRKRWSENATPDDGSEATESAIPTVAELLDRSIATTSAEIARLNVKGERGTLTSEEHRSLIALNRNVIDLSDQQRKYDENSPERSLSDKELLELAPDAIKMLEDNVGKAKH